MNNKRIQILSDAENDLDEGRKFYGKQGENVGDYFWDSLLSDIESLVFFAGIHRKVFGYYRRGFLMQFIMMSMKALLLWLLYCQYEGIRCG